MIEQTVSIKLQTVQDVDHSWNGVYRIGGLALLAAGILYLIGTTLGFYLGFTPANTQAYLQSLSAHPGMALITYWIFALADVLFIPAILGLYLSLKEINKNIMLIAAGFLVCFVLLDLGVTEWNSLALVTLSQSIALASSDAARAAYQASADWGLATIPVATFFSWIGTSIGFLLTAIVMRKAIFGRHTARLGIIVYSVAILASFYFILPLPAVLGLTLTPILVAYGAWLIAAGRRLYKLGR
jgi:hypothetical protein